MNKKKNKKTKYNYFGNLKFVISEHWRFSKSYVLSQIVLTPFGALVSVVSAYLPKVVLDCVENKSTFSELIIKVGIMSLVLLLFNYLNKVLNLKCIQGRNTARTLVFHKLLCEKIMDMDYNNYIYNETRVLREKAYKSISGWDAATHRFFELNCSTASAVFGFSAFTTIIARCNPIFIPILVVCYAMSALGWMILQKYKDKIKEKVSAVFLKLEYVCYRSKDFSNAKDIRIYNMTDFLMRKIDKHLDEMLYFNKKRNDGHFFNVLLEDVLKFGVSLGAYLYLVYLKLNSEMMLGDFSLYFGAITGFGTWLNQLIDGIVACFFVGDMVFQKAPASTGFALFVNSPVLAILIVVMSIVAIVLTAKYHGLSEKKEYEAYSEAVKHSPLMEYYNNKYLNESESGKDVRIFNEKALITEEIKEKFYSREISYRRKLFKIWAGLGQISTISTNLLGGAIYIFVGLKALAGTFGAGSVVEYYGAITKLITDCTDIAGNIGYLRANNTNLKSEIEYLELVSDMENGTRNIAGIDPKTAVFEFCDATQEIWNIFV